MTLEQILMEAKEVKNMALMAEIEIHDTGGQVWFSQWREANGYYSRRRLYDDMICDGATEAEVDEVWDALEEEFVADCEAAGLNWVMDE